VSCAQCEGIRDQFGHDIARRELRRFLRWGPRKSTRLLLQAIGPEVAGSSVLDVGGGVGVIHHELLDQGARSATQVDASPAYITVSRGEAIRRGHGDRVAYVEGDFVELAPTLPPADVVTLDRVICCYPDMPALVSRSAALAERVYAVVYPRANWFMRLGTRLANTWLRFRRSSFRVFIHSPTAIDDIVRAEGFARRYAGRTLLWEAVVFERRP
jgi:SAM-dependent methyltransferase